MALTLAAGGAAVGLLVVVSYRLRPKDPIMKTTEIQVKGFGVRPITVGILPVVSIDLHVVCIVYTENPNVAPVNYPSSTIDIFYNDQKVKAFPVNNFVGECYLEKGTLQAWEKTTLELPAELKGVEMGASQGMNLLNDVINRKLVLVAVSTFAGEINLLKGIIRHRFTIVCRNDITFDPLTLGVTASDSKAYIKLLEEPEQSEEGKSRGAEQLDVTEKVDAST
eukprot:SM000079S22482  [mRNA]  locus=s79:427627:429547:- [translate_table: standard]